MIYTILIIGLILIYISLKPNNKKSKTSKIIKSIKNKENEKSESQRDFSDVLEQSADSFYEREILKNYITLEDKVIELEEKINHLEKKIVEKDKETLLNYENLKERIDIISFDMCKIDENIKHITLVNNSEFDPEELIDSEIDIPKEEISSNKSDNENEEKNKIIFDLYNEGKSIDEIASILNIGKGELLLRIGLKKREK